jgi:hypothetical protein
VAGVRGLALRTLFLRAWALAAAGGKFKLEKEKLVKVKNQHFNKSPTPWGLQIGQSELLNIGSSFQHVPTRPRGRRNK